MWTHPPQRSTLRDLSELPLKLELSDLPLRLSMELPIELPMELSEPRPPLELESPAQGCLPTTLKAALFID